MSIPGAGNPLLLGGAGGYKIERSLRFDPTDTPGLSRTPASAGNRKTWTWSGWIKRSDVSTARNMLLSAGTNPSGADLFTIEFSSNQVRIADGGATPFFTSTAFYRDPSAWLHLLIAVDTTQATAANRLRIYVNGSEIAGTFSYPSQNYDTQVNNTSIHYIGRWSGGLYLSGYIAEIHFIDGQALTPSSFGETDANGIWQPKRYTGTYGTNGFQLKFADNSNNTATTLGKDTSPNGNNWTPNNLSVTAGVGNDSLVDSPTNYGTDTGAGGEVRGNYCTLNPLDIGANISNAQGNLYALKTTTGWTIQRSIIGVSSGKYYFEGLVTGNIVADGSQKQAMIGVANNAASLANYIGVDANGWSYNFDGLKINAGVGSAYGSGYSSGTVIGVALDLDNGKIWFSRNGIWQASGNPATGTNPAYSNVTGTVMPAIGLGGLAAGNVSWDMNFGQRPWAYPGSVPSGFKALCTQNLPAPTITKPSTVMDVKLYTGNGGTQTISGLGFSPDLVWIKNRTNATQWHVLTDSVRGVTKSLYSNDAAAEETYTDRLQSFDSAGFSLGAAGSGGVNTNTQPYVAWTWDAGSTTVTNTSGTITSQVRANASAGFSIATITQPSSGSFSVGHGLGVAPSFFIYKVRGATSNWGVWHQSLTGGTYYLLLNTTGAQVNDSTVWSSSPTSSVVNIGSGWTAAGAVGAVLYSFAPVAGYSAFGSYTGNGSADGPFVYTGFRPRWLLYKNTAAGNNWILIDTSRDPINVCAQYLYANTSGAEATFGVFDFLSNGFKARTGDSQTNLASSTYIYAAFAESPFALARAR